MKIPSLLVMILCVFSVTFLLAGCDPDETSKPCVVMLGDSIFALSGRETRALEDLSGDTYRTYYISGAQMEGGPIKTIPKQYEDAIADGPIRTVILDGGGNDVLIGGLVKCSVAYGGELRDQCDAIIDKTLASFETLFRQMIADGVENIIYQGYYYVRNKWLWQVTDELQDMGDVLVAEMAAEYPDVKFVFIDPRLHFDQGDTSYLILDGIHPTRAASETLANLVWDAMVEDGIEQGESCP
jgi:hypothetical protein